MALLFRIASLEVLQAALMRFGNAGKIVDEPIRLREEVCHPLKAPVGFFLRDSQQFDGLCQGLVTLRQLL